MTAKRRVFIILLTGGQWRLALQSGSLAFQITGSTSLLKVTKQEVVYVRDPLLF